MQTTDTSVNSDRLTSAAIKAAAHDFGFDACGIAPADDFPELKFFRDWLARGYAGEMTYLHRSAERRADVRAVLPAARSVIVTATNYHTNRPYSTEVADPYRAQIARYAWGDDYHDVIGGRLGRLLAWMREQSPEPFEARAYVDTGPVQERVYAQYAGIGWIGAPAFDQCGSCTLCLEACPTHALAAPYVLDSRACISYLTIEHRGDIPADQRPALGSHVYGCDICQEVCPWNGVAPRSDDAAWQPRPAWDGADVRVLAGRTDDELAAATRGSAMRRAKVQGLRRNIAIALSNAQSVTEDGG